MPGIVTHLVIAEKVLKRLPEGMVSNKHYIMPVQ